MLDVICFSCSPDVFSISQVLNSQKKDFTEKVIVQEVGSYFNSFFCLRDEIHEASQRLVRLIPHVAKLHHHLLLQLVIDNGHGERRRLVCQEAAIVCALQVELQICKGDTSRLGQLTSSL